VWEVEGSDRREGSSEEERRKEKGGRIGEERRAWGQAGELLRKGLEHIASEMERAEKEYLQKPDDSEVRSGAQAKLKKKGQTRLRKTDNEELLKNVVITTPSFRTSVEHRASRES
jgi:hypothetical protein